MITRPTAIVFGAGDMLGTKHQNWQPNLIEVIWVGSIISFVADLN